MAEPIYLLPIKETLATAWQKVSGSKKTFWIAFGIFLAFMFACGFIESMLQSFYGKDAFIPNVFNFLVKVFSFMLQMGILYMGIRRAFDLPIHYQQLFYALNIKMGWQLIFLYLLQFLVLIIPFFLVFLGLAIYDPDSTLMSIIAAFICLIGAIAIIYLPLRMILGSAFVLDKEMGAVAALKLSFKATQENFWRIAAVYILQFLIVTISAIPFGIGLIWTMPFSLITYGVSYKKLLNNAS